MQARTERARGGKKRCSGQAQPRDLSGGRGAEAKKTLTKIATSWSGSTDLDAVCVLQAI